MNDSLATLLHKIVTILDRNADSYLRQNFNITYQRAYFLFTIKRLGVTSQRTLAKELGYSPASVSTMLAELVKTGYVAIKQDPSHGRRHLVSLTPRGDKEVSQGQRELDDSFNQMLSAIGFDVREYTTLTQKLYKALQQKGETK